MGTDIHGPWIEQLDHPDSETDKWWTFAVMDTGRSYRLFDMLAGARSGMGAICEPKDPPENPSYSYRRHLRDRSSCHDHSWLTRSELGLVGDEYELRYRERSWDIDLWLKIMRHCDNPTRVVFCFDS